MEIKLTPLRDLTSKVVGEIWDDLDIQLDDPIQNHYANIVFSFAKEERDEEIMLVAREVLGECS